MSTPSFPPGSFVPLRFLKRQLFIIGFGAALTLTALILWARLKARLLTTDFLSHAYCYLGNPRLVWTNGVADSLIGIAYLAISVMLGYLGYKGWCNIPFTGCPWRLDFLSSTSGFQSFPPGIGKGSMNRERLLPLLPNERYGTAALSKTTRDLPILQRMMDERVFKNG